MKLFITFLLLFQTLNAEIQNLSYGKFDEILYQKAIADIEQNFKQILELHSNPSSKLLFQTFSTPFGGSFFYTSKFLNYSLKKCSANIESNTLSNILLEELVNINFRNDDEFKNFELKTVEDTYSYLFFICNSTMNIENNISKFTIENVREFNQYFLIDVNFKDDTFKSVKYDKILGSVYFSFDNLQLIEDLLYINN
jgi:hypothetical protein